MKRYFVNIAAAMLLAACSGNKASDAEGQAADNTEKADSVEVKDNATRYTQDCQYTQ